MSLVYIAAACFVGNRLSGIPTLNLSGMGVRADEVPRSVMASIPLAWNRNCAHTSSAPGRSPVALGNRR